LVMVLVKIRVQLIEIFLLITSLFIQEGMLRFL
jgi:hypothetical protein